MRTATPKTGQPLLDEVKRIRLLVEADIPAIAFYGAAIAHNHDLDTVWRVLLPDLVKMPGTRITDKTRSRRRRGQRVALTLPDGKQVEVGMTGRPPKVVLEWKDRGYEVDWEALKMVEAKQTE